MNKRYDKSYKVVSNKEICDGYFELKVKADLAVVNCIPGQFFMISVAGVFLRRPISIHDVKGNIVSFLYKIVGQGTKNLSDIQSGTLQLLGPLGRGYDLDIINKPKSHNKKDNFDPIIVAGGTGIASVHFLAAMLKRKGTLYYGARLKKDLLCLDKFKNIGWKIIASTEDGSKGYKGYITDILKNDISSDNILFACGPTAMLKQVVKIAKEKHVTGFVSLEEKMACGLGNCQGCAVKIKGQMKMTCKDGPVFKIEDIEL